MKKVIITQLLLFAALGAVYAQSPGHDHYYNQRFASAERYFHTAINGQPSDAGNWYWLVQSYIQQGQPQKAKDTLQFAPGSMQDDALLLAAKGHLLLQLKDSVQASAMFDRAIDISKSKDPDVLAAVARAALQSAPQFALDVLSKAIKRDKHNPSLYVLQGNAWLQLHNGTEAYKSYKQALDEKNDHAEAYYRLGKLFQSQKNTDLFMENFNKAVEVDPSYAPALYELYYYYMYTDPVKGMAWFNKYRPVAETTIQLDYTYTDLLYLTKDYQQAIGNANALLQKNRDSIPPRLYKLIAYSQKELGDTLSAIKNMREYFTNEADSNYVVKDFETMAILYLSQPAAFDSVMTYYAKAAEKTEDAEQRGQYYKQLSVIAADQKKYGEQATWLGQYVMSATKVKNTDIFNWGIAAFKAVDFVAADSVFKRYAIDYPDQPHGFYWRARSIAAIDTAMADTTVASLYQKVLDMTESDSTSAYARQFKINANSYLAAYAANVQKDSEKAIFYFERILALDPGNAQAKRYIDILRKSDPENDNEANN
jgi:tetratricopeptide (TPR) repeat protein